MDGTCSRTVYSTQDSIAGVHMANAQYQFPASLRPSESGEKPVGTPDPPKGDEAPVDPNAESDLGARKSKRRRRTHDEQLKAIEEKIERLTKQREDVAKAKKETEQARAARERERERKLDARRKIIIGGAVLAWAERDAAARQVAERILDQLDERDRTPFNGWRPPWQEHDDGIS